MNDLQKKMWHSQYTLEQIKSILAALNRLPIGKALDVDGIVGKETLAAIELFQKDHANLLKVDGLVGDKTLAALGLTLNDPDLPATRKGVDLRRKQSNRSSLEKDWEKKFNSKEFMDMILSLGGALDRQVQKEVMAYQALPYLSPENAARVRYFFNWDADDYDKDLVKLRVDASKRAEGISSFKNYIEKLMIRPSYFLEDIEKFQKDYKLSNAEMQELLKDPDILRALLASQESRENALMTRSQKAKSAKFENDVREAMNEAGWYTGNAVAGLLSLTAMPGAYALSAGGSKLVDGVVDLFSRGKYSDWSDFIHDKVHLDDPVLQFGAENFSNPGQLFAWGYAPKTILRNQKVLTGYKSIPVRAGKPRTVPAKVKTMTKKSLVHDPINTAGWVSDPIVTTTTLKTVPGYTTKGSKAHIRRIPQYKILPVQETILKAKWLPYLTDIYFSDYPGGAPASDKATAPITEFDHEQTYGPYLGVYRFPREKFGGKLNYLNILNY